MTQGISDKFWQAEARSENIERVIKILVSIVLGTFLIFLASYLQRRRLQQVN